MPKSLNLKTYNFHSKLETFTKLKKRIPSLLVFLVMKIKKSIQSMYKKKCCEEKHVDLLLIGEEDKRHYVLIKDFNTYFSIYSHSLHRVKQHFSYQVKLGCNA